MSVKYKIIEETHGYSYIEKTKEDGTISFVPMDESNSDYQRYLAWLEDPEAEQFTPIVTEDE
jgi:hypothetical protein